MGIRRVNVFFVRLSMRYLPDPYLFVIILTMVTFLVAVAFTDRPLTSLFGHWYTGVFDFFTYSGLQ